MVKKYYIGMMYCYVRPDKISIFFSYLEILQSMLHKSRLPELSDQS